MHWRMEALFAFFINIAAENLHLSQIKAKENGTAHNGYNCFRVGTKSIALVIREVIKDSKQPLKYSH